jgi:SMI1-KNR4 cell-wall
MGDDLLDDLPADWWDDTGSAARGYVEPPLTDQLVREVEAELGVHLPASYVALMRRHNGGVPRLRDHPAPHPTTWADDHVAISGIFGIGRTHDFSLGGPRSGLWWSEEWSYPDVGVYVADCPSAGHDLVALDYRGCGPDGEPGVVHVDEERGYAVTELAPDFATFVRGLCRWPEGDEE